MSDHSSNSQGFESFGRAGQIQGGSVLQAGSHQDIYTASPGKERRHHILYRQHVK